MVLSMVGVRTEAGQPAAADRNARETRAALHDVLQQYPPALTQVLQLDPSLLGNDDYLAPYPAVASYLKQHPEIARNPAFFLGTGRPARTAIFDSESPRAQSIREMSSAVFFVTFFLGFTAAVAGIVYLARALMDHRRWLTAVKVQTEAHAHVVDRLTSNEDLITYLQSATGQRLLTLAPAIAAPDVRMGSAPVARILWSLQTGIVMAMAGGGLWLANGRLIEEAAQPLYVVALLAVAVGIGFVVSAAASFVLSRRLGLIAAEPTHG